MQTRFVAAVSLQIASRALLLVSLCTITPSHGRSYAQDTAPAAAPTPAYDVMSIKPNNSASGNVSIETDDDRLTASNVSLKSLLAGAYDIREEFISGLPGPLESARFDIQAKISDPDRAALKTMTPEQDRLKLLPLLIERFHLKTHTEVKILPVYELVQMSEGPKFKPSIDQSITGNGSTHIQGSRTQATLSANDVSMSSLARSLAGQVHRAVIDKTGLTGNFDVTLQWSNEDSPDSGAEPLPSIFTAMQEQLGLKLRPAKGPVQTLVVDQAAMPSEN